MFGETEGGKLGLPENSGDHTVPQEVTGIKGKVTWVSCGGSHTVAVTGEFRPGSIPAFVESVGLLRMKCVEFL